MGTKGIKYAAIVLILLFSQKLGLRLYIHNVLHVAKNVQTDGDETSSDGQFHMVCDCLDEALMPLVSSGTIDLCVPQKEYTRLFAGNIPPALCRPKIFHPLRGPPAMHA